MKNYANANFIPQKQPNDRLNFLCQSRELNPLVSLYVEEGERDMDDPAKQREVLTESRKNSMLCQKQAIS